MAYYTTNVVSTDIYKVTGFIEQLKAKYVDIPEDTLVLGVYGYLNNVLGNLTQNTATMAAEYSLEAIPTKAKYERNVISHALALGINSINATPAKIDIILGISEQQMINNMENDRIVIDKEFVFYIGEDQQYPYLLDYDIEVIRHRLPTGEYLYTANYLLDETNQLANLKNPYLPSLGYMNISGDKLITIKTTIRQVTHTQVNKKIIVTNPLETKTFTFSFQDQLAYFYVMVEEEQDDGTYGEPVYYEPVYDGLYDYTTDPDKKFINYMYLDEKTIRLRFDRDNQPHNNTEITVHVYTTLGEECNFKLNNYQTLKSYTSERYPYTGMYLVVQNVTDSEQGDNKLTIEQLKEAIPAEALSRGSITTYTDLNNFFNALQRDDCKLYLLRKVHNQIERLYYLYIMMKDGSNVVPTNTINVSMDRSIFSGINRNNFIIKPMSKFYTDLDTDSTYATDESDQDELLRMDENGFLYANPYLVVINKSPFYVSYYLTLVNYYRELYFEYINNDSMCQFVALNFHAYREYYDEPDTFKIDLTCSQSINTDFQLVKYEEDGVTIRELNFKVIGIIYRTNNDDEEYAYKYIESELVDYTQDTAQYNMQFKFDLNDVISPNETFIYSTSGLKSLNSGEDFGGYIPPNVRIRFFFVVKMDQDFGREFVLDNVKYNLDDYIPGLDGWTLTNVYGSGEQGLDIFYDYSDICNSFIDLTQDDEGNITYMIYKMPVVRYMYLNSNDRINNFLELIDERRRYIQEAIFLLDDSFGIDYKFFNTYGKSLFYNINREENIDHINLKLKFEIKFESREDQLNTLDDITNSIKEYIEDMNNITDLHIPNLITYITNLYRENLVYIKFIGLNDYDSLWQSIYKNPEIEDNYFLETQTVPEFINVNTLLDNTPDITYNIIDPTA